VQQGKKNTKYWYDYAIANVANGRLCQAPSHICRRLAQERLHTFYASRPEDVLGEALRLAVLALYLHRICQAADPLELPVKFLSEGLEKTFAGGVRPIGDRVNSGELSFVVAV
jgi:hypothetical protein